MERSRVATSTRTAFVANHTSDAGARAASSRGRAPVSDVLPWTKVNATHSAAAADRYGMKDRHADARENPANHARAANLPWGGACGTLCLALPCRRAGEPAANWPAFTFPSTAEPASTCAP